MLCVRKLFELPEKCKTKKVNIEFIPDLWADLGITAPYKVFS
jgi:hypothetical protein